VLKNFPTPDEVREAVVAAGETVPTVTELAHYSVAAYSVGRRAG
jgi:hypothetical protein